MEVLAFGLLVAVIYAFGQLWFARLFGEDGYLAGQYFLVLSGLLAAVASQLGGVDWLIGLFIGLSAGLVIIWCVTRWLGPLRPKALHAIRRVPDQVNSAGEVVAYRLVADAPTLPFERWRADIARGKYFEYLWLEQVDVSIRYSGLRMTFD